MFWFIVEIHTNNIDDQYLFVDELNGDFRLDDYSACIGSALDTSISLSLDLDGYVRPNPSGSNPDIGAYENSLGTPLNYGWSDSLAYD